MNKKYTLLFLTANIALAQIQQPDPVREAGGVYLQSFNREIMEDNNQPVDPEGERYISWFKDFILANKYNDSTVKMTFRTREVLVKILTKEIKPVPKPVKTSANILEDSRVLGGEASETLSMPNHLFPGYTLAGEVLKALMLAQPTSDQKELTRRQSLISKTIQAESLHQTLPPILKEMNQYEPTVVSLLDEKDQIYDTVFQGLVNRYGGLSSTQKFCRKVSDLTFMGAHTLLYYLRWSLTLAVTTSPFLNKRYCSCRFLTGISCAVFSLGVQAGISTLETYLQLILKENERLLYRVMRVRIDLLSRYVHQALSLQLIPDLPEDLKLTFDARETNLLEAFLEGAEWLIDEDPHAQEDYQKYASEILWYPLELKQTLARILYQSARIDMHLAIARGMKQNASGSNQITFAEFKGTRPGIIARGLWNPLLDPRDAVTNDIRLEAGDQCLPRFTTYTFTKNTCSHDSEPFYKNFLLSGGNASGKSTLMRAITVNAIYLAQVFGVATADFFQTGLFHVIHSQMDKHDRTGEFSSYEGELKHSMEIFTKAESLQINENMLVCFDELFSNTDPDESLYVTNKVLNALAKQPRIINIVSSHYEVETPDNTMDSADEYVRMHMHLQKINNTLVKTYKLRSGHNKETNGLYLLAEKFWLFPDIYSELEQLIEEGNNE